MSRGWIPRGPLQGPVSIVGGEVEEGRLGTEPFDNDNKMIVVGFPSLLGGRFDT